MPDVTLIDQRLEKCRAEMASRPDSRPRVLPLVDELLDQRLAAFGIVTVMPAPTGPICHGCGNVGRLVAGYVDCFECDRRTCSCGRKVPGRTDPKCPAGHEIRDKPRG